MKALFYPDFPELELYTIVAIFNQLNYFASKDPESDFDFAFSWQDKTWVEQDDKLTAIAQHKPVINLGCKDISKHNVERIFSELFGYSTMINPLEYQGKVVCKPNENAAARGTIIECPIDSVDEQMVYQAFIDCRESADVKVEYRVPVTFGEIPCVYLQRKQYHQTQAKTVPESTELCLANDVFSQQEIEKISAFCHQIGLDCGDLDILRDFTNERLYIIDANKTGGGFGLLNRFRWTVEDRRRAIELVAEGFEKGLKKAMQALNH